MGSTDKYFDDWVDIKDEDNICMDIDDIKDIDIEDIGDEDEVV